MKIRSGFVSNSSSSSFIVHGIKISTKEYEKLDLKKLNGLVVEEDRNFFSDDGTENYIIGKSGGWLNDGVVTKLGRLTNEEKTELIEKFLNVGINIEENQIETYIQFIRTGFVSNSSSSSFAIYGNSFDYEELKNVIKTFDENIQESLKDGGDCLTNHWSPEGGLEMYEDYESQIVYLGRSWTDIGDDETGKEFKERVAKELSELIGEDVECRSIETTIDS